MAKMIDIQTVVEEIQSSLDISSYSEHDKGFDDGLKYVLDLIEKAPALTPPNEWVSVDERLPGVSGNYICAVKDKNGSVWTIPAEWSLEMKMWIGAFGEIKNIVTHWMLLPAPPDRRPPEQIDMLERMESE